MIDLSIFGTTCSIKASNTLPTPQPITHFADDADGLDIPETVIAEMEMGVNGDGISWAVASVINPTVNVIPNTASHSVMNIIYEANRPQKGKLPARDIIEITRIAPDGSTLVLSGGKLVSGMPATSMSSAGRLKTASYKLKFAAMTFTMSPDAALNV